MQKVLNKMYMSKKTACIVVLDKIRNGNVSGRKNEMKKKKNHTKKLIEWCRRIILWMR